MTDSIESIPRLHSKQYSNKRIIEALKAANGGVYLAARKLDCNPATIYIRAKEVPAVQAVIDNMRGELVDMAESALKKSVLAGESWGVSLALKTLGKGRGYVERVENEAVGVTMIRVIHEDVKPDA